MKATHQIIDIYPADAYYEDHEHLIKKKGFFELDIERKNGTVGGDFKFFKSLILDDELIKIVTFHCVKIKTL